jgi:hypothetical protein
MLALLNLASGECAKRNSTGQAGIQNGLIFGWFNGSRVSPNPASSTGQPRGLARNDSFAPSPSLSPLKENRNFGLPNTLLGIL